jgi:NADH:ubiquinone oxidoreductase subunit 5 (subunit L)/multisubunit Na+/H+ antiporter MnhA subunit
MPVTTALVTAGALAAAALPPGNGFISEWLLLQSLLHQGGTLTAIAAPIGVAVIATTAGVGVAAYVKALGTGFLARPRSAAAEAATESPASMLTGMALAAIGCAVLAIVPAVVVPSIANVLNVLHVTAMSPPDIGAVTAKIWPLWLAVAVVGAAAIVAVTARAAGRARRRAIAWDCGDGPLTARMEYTATSFAEPLQRVFDDALAPERDVDVTHHEESVYVLDAIRFQQRIPDRIENRLYRPLIDGVRWLGQRARRWHRAACTAIWRTCWPRSCWS